MLFAVKDKSDIIGILTSLLIIQILMNTFSNDLETRESLHAHVKALLLAWKAAQNELFLKNVNWRLR